VEKCFKKREAAAFAIKLFSLFHAAEFATGSMARFVWFHTAANVFFGERIDVRAQLTFEITFHLSLAKNPQVAQCENTQPLHLMLLRRARANAS